MFTQDRRQTGAFRRIMNAVALFGALLMGSAFAGGQERQAAGSSAAISRLQAIQPESSRTRVLVLATFHLRQIADSLKPAMLDGLIERLERFRPDSICIEALPGPRVQELELRKDAGPLYADVLEGFAARHLKMGKQALGILGTTPPAAARKVRELLASARALGPGKMTPPQRATLALWMLAAYDPDSAALQWSYLTKEERKAQKEIPAALAGEIDNALTRANEGPAIAARLARKLGLERLDPVDDFEDLEGYMEIEARLEEDTKDSLLLAAASKSPVYTESEARLQECVRKGDLLPQFILLNSAAYAAADVDAQWGVFLRTHFASGSDRGRLGLWENRNLKIAARIRTVAALRPGGRILVIYGAAHRPFLEAYLSSMADIRIVGLDELGTK